MRDNALSKCLLALAWTVLIAALLFHQVDLSYSAPQALTIVSPGVEGVVLPALDDFATTVMKDPWDMNEPTDLAFYRSESNFINSSFADGLYTAQMTLGNGGEAVRLLSAGAPNNTALRVGKQGYAYPIDSQHYRYLSFRIYSGSSAAASGLIQWYADDTFTNAVMGVSNSYGVSSGWGTYVLDLETIGIQLGSQDWDGQLRELLIHPFAGAGSAGAVFKLDWARLTAENPLSARPYTLQWTGDGSGGAVSLYASLDKTLTTDEDILIADGLSASGGSYEFQTGLLPPGSYYIAASNTADTAWSAGALVINDPSRISIDKPSMTSGQEYAADEIGNAWDMADAADLNADLPPNTPTCVTNESYSGGIYSAVIPNPNCPAGATHSDAVLFIGGMDPNPAGTLDPLVDTSKYRYLSYRFNHSGTQDVGRGWVSRFGWWQLNAAETEVTELTVMSRDIMILENWNTYKVDLWAADVIDEAHPVQVPWASSHPNRLRFDPTELAQELAPATIQLDWIKLTAMDEVLQGAPFGIDFTLLNKASEEVTLTVYYDGDQIPGNGRTLAQLITPQAPPPVPPTMTHKVYLPAVGWRTGEPIATGLLWDTASVTPATYWISIDVDDGYNVLTHYSEAPVIVLSANKSQLHAKSAGRK